MAENEKIKYDQDMTIGQILALNPNAEVVLMSFGMHCVSCFVSQMETLGEACEVHGINIKDVLKKLDEMPVDEKLNIEDYLD